MGFLGDHLDAVHKESPGQHGSIFVGQHFFGPVLVDEIQKGIGKLDLGDDVLGVQHIDNVPVDGQVGIPAFVDAFFDDVLIDSQLGRVVSADGLMVIAPVVVRENVLL